MQETSLLMASQDGRYLSLTLALGAFFFWFFGDVLFPPSTLGVSKLGSPQGIGGSILVVRTWLQGNGFPHFAVQTSSKPTSHL